MVRSIRYNYLLNVVKVISGMLFPLISFAYVSRVLSVEGIGKIDYVRNVVAIFIIVATLGMTTYGTREGAKARINKMALSKLVRELLIINLITTILSYLFFFCIVFFVDKFNGYQDIFFIYGLCIGFTALGLDWLYNALEDFKYITFRYLTFQLLSLILLFLFVKEKSDYLIYTGILTFSTVGSNLYNFIHSRKYVNLVYRGPINLVRHLKPILILFSCSLIGNIYLSLDSVMLGWMTSPYHVGLYSAANKMNRICLAIITSLFVVLLPRASYYIKAKESEKLNRLIEKSLHFIFLMSFPIVVLVLVLSRDILIILSGYDFAPATLCSQILSVIIILIPISTMASKEVIIPFGSENKLFYSSIIGAMVNALLNYVLIPYYQETGAAIASVIAELSVAVITSYYAVRCMDRFPALNNFWHYMVAAIVMLLVLQPLYILLNEGLVRCVLSLVVGLFFYLYILYFLRNTLLLDLCSDVKAMILNIIR